MKKIVMYQKSTCGTCKKEIAYSTRVKISFQEVDIIKNSPSSDFLNKNIDEDNLNAFINKHSNPYRDLNLARKKVSKTELIDLMLKDPNLIKRPILIDGKKIYFGYSEI